MLKKSLFIFGLCMTVCNVFAGQDWYGFECTPEIAGDYVFSNNPFHVKKCNSDGTWTTDENYIQTCYTIDEMTGIDLPIPSGKRMVSQFDFATAVYAKTDITPVAETSQLVNVYRYSSDKNDMCHWCMPGFYGIVKRESGFSGFYCLDNEQRAWCEFAKNKNNVNVEWNDDDNKCNCIDEDTSKEWDTTEHKCVDATTGSNDVHNDFECEPDNYYIKTDIDDPANIYKCDADKNLSESEYYLLPCFDVADAKPSRSAPESFTPYGTKTNYRTYLNTDKVSHVTGNDNIYPWSDDKTVMCWWCNSTDDWFATVNQAGNMECFNNEEKAWCFYAINKEGKNAVWDDNSGECKCLTNGETWKDHTCKEKSQQEQNNKCSTPWGDLPEAKAFKDKTTEDCRDITKTETNVDLVNTWEVVCRPGLKLVCKPFTCIDKYEPNVETGKCEPKPDVSEKEFKTAKETVDNFLKNADKNASKWKDVEGNFNTARLASDLTAGVVLGTVGGVVSGVVIKKKQIEKGFEVLHCAIGGQSVADWGDTFTIGLKRY